MIGNQLHQFARDEGAVAALCQDVEVLAEPEQDSYLLLAQMASCLCLLWPLRPSSLSLTWTWNPFFPKTTSSQL